MFRSRLMFTALAALVWGFSALGCEAPGAMTDPHSSTAARPAAIHHIVVIDLEDPADADEMLADSDAMLGAIPSVVSYFAGRHHETGRDHIFSDYDIALYVGFDSDAGYAEYVDHPLHLRFVEHWEPRVDSMRIYDVFDDGSR